MSRRNTEELLVGTWIGISLIADALVRGGIVDREALVLPLAKGATLAHDQRRVPLSVLRRLIEVEFAGGGDRVAEPADIELHHVC